MSDISEQLRGLERELQEGRIELNRQAEIEPDSPQDEWLEQRAHGVEYALDKLYETFPTLREPPQDGWYYRES